MIPEDMDRTADYIRYRVCERFKIVPSDFKNISRAEQVNLLGYEQVRQTEEIEQLKLLIQASGAGMAKKAIGS